MNELSAEEVAQRRAELIRMKNLLFYREMKARRQNKINSKTYRRILKKQKERQAQEEYN